MTEIIYCPRCGKQFTSETSFCRTCGLSLSPIVEMVEGDKAPPPKVTSRPNFKLFRIGIAMFIVGLVVGLVNGALKDFELYPNSYGKLVFMLFVAAGMLTLGAGFLFPTKKYTRGKTSDSTVGELTDANVDSYISPQTTNRLEKQPIGSVTEPTTRNLKIFH